MGVLQRFLHRPQTLFVRRAIFQVHLWMGITAALYMAVIGITGSVLVFRPELDSLRFPERWRQSRTAPPTNAGAVIARLRQAYPTRTIVSLMAPGFATPVF